MTVMHILGFLCSLLIGICLGLIGGGGSILTLPVFVYLLGINPMLSTAYSLFVVGVTSLIGSYNYILKKEISYPTTLLFALPSLVSISIIRSHVFPRIPDTLLITNHLIFSKDMFFMVFCGLIMLVASVSMLSRWNIDTTDEPGFKRYNYLLMITSGTLIGALTGIIGVGGGFLIIPTLVLVVRLPMKKAIGTSLLIIAIKSLFSFAGDLMSISIQWPFLIGFTTVSVVGILVGSYCSRYISGFRLRKSFGWFLMLLSLAILSRETWLAISPAVGNTRHSYPMQPDTEFVWKAPNPNEILHQPNAGLIRYGRNLIRNTSWYLGPQGRVAHLSNGMNCQNCHLNAGTKPWGNNYGAVAATYPRFRERSGTTETIVKRVNDCLERSLNGRSLDSNSQEMRAIVAYILFIGQAVPKGKSPKGSSIWPLPFLERAADPVKGKLIFSQKCITCHGANGQGQSNRNGSGYIYPPLWGKNSYNTGAGLYRLSRFAGYIKANMPLGSTWNNPQLSDEDAWDLAAFINSQPRPVKQFKKDWPRIEGKPIDHSFGPYADPFSEQQHKFGPFKPIDQFKKKATG